MQTEVGQAQLLAGQPLGMQCFLGLGHKDQ